jgi:hypothetical protein
LILFDLKKISNNVLFFLVANDSHGDASMAHLDSSFDLIGIYTCIDDDHYNVSTENLSQYFEVKKGLAKVTQKSLETNQKGPKYKLSASGYIFRKK